MQTPINIPQNHQRTDLPKRLAKHIVQTLHPFKCSRLTTAKSGDNGTRFITDMHGPSAKQPEPYRRVIHQRMFTKTESWGEREVTFYGIYPALPVQKHTSDTFTDTAESSSIGDEMWFLARNQRLSKPNAALTLWKGPLCSPWKWWQGCTQNGH